MSRRIQRLLREVRRKRRARPVVFALCGPTLYRAGAAEIWLAGKHVATVRGLKWSSPPTYRVVEFRE